MKKIKECVQPPQRRLPAYDNYVAEGGKWIGLRTKARWALLLMRAGKLPRDPAAAATLFNRLELAEREQRGGAQKMFDEILKQT